MGFLIQLFFFLVDALFYKKKQRKGKKITWFDAIFTPTLKISIYIFFLTTIGVVAYLIISRMVNHSK